jgi:hypothetical protein
MLIVLYGWKPYIQDLDNLIAFIVQMVWNHLFPNHLHLHQLILVHSKQAITLTFCLGLLSLSAADEDDEDSKDWAFGLFVKFTVVLIGSFYHLLHYTAQDGSSLLW